MIPRSIKDSGSAPRTWKALAPKTPGPRILNICSPPEATNDSPLNNKYSYTTIRKRWPYILFEHGKKPYICSHSEEEESIPLKSKIEDSLTWTPSLIPSETNSEDLYCRERPCTLKTTIKRTRIKYASFLMLLICIREWRMEDKEKALEP